MGDQHQGCRRRERRRAAIGRVAAEHLAQARVAEMAAEFAPQRRERLDPQPFESVAADQRQRAGLHGPYEGLLDEPVDRLRLDVELVERPCLRGPGEIADRLFGACRIGEQIEPRATRPSVAGQCLHRLHRDVGGQILANCGEQLLEHPSHGEHGRPNVEGDAADQGRLEFAAGLAVALERDHIETACRQFQRRCETTRASADDYDAFAWAARVSRVIHWLDHCGIVRDWEAAYARGSQPKIRALARRGSSDMPSTTSRIRSAMTRTLQTSMSQAHPPPLSDAHHGGMQGLAASCTRCSGGRLDETVSLPPEHSEISPASASNVPEFSARPQSRTSHTAVINGPDLSEIGSVLTNRSGPQTATSPAAD